MQVASRFSRLIELLVCPSCLSKNLSLVNDSLYCSVCKVKFKIANSKVFFTDPAGAFTEQITPSHFNKEKWSKWRQANFNFFADYLGEKPSSSFLLDLGAGPSQFRELISRFDLAVGMDFRPLELVDVVGDLTKQLPFRSESFDIVMLSNTMEHIPNTDFLISEIYRVLKPGGLIIGTIPFLMRVHQKPYDYNRYTNYKLAMLLKEANFKEISVINLGKSVDVYESMQLHFFYYLLSSTFSKNNFIHSFKKLVARIMWRVQKFIFKLFLPVYNNAISSPEYTQGYGFLAKK